MLLLHAFINVIDVFYLDKVNVIVVDCVEWRSKNVAMHNMCQANIRRWGWASSAERHTNYQRSPQKSVCAGILLLSLRPMNFAFAASFSILMMKTKLNQALLRVIQL